MKLLVTTLLMLLLLNLSIQAEEQISGITGKGVKLGFGFASISSSHSLFGSEESSFKGAIGAFVTYNLSRRVSLQPELLYVAKGAGGSDILSFTRNWDQNYLEIPVLIKYSLSGSGKLIPSVYLGPAFGVLLSADFQDPFVIHWRDTKDMMKSYDFSFLIGGAVDYGHFSLDVRYTIGMVNIYDLNKWNDYIKSEDANSMLDLSDYLMSGTENMKNRFLCFSLGYRF